MNTFMVSQPATTPALIAIGDVHGCSDLLSRLLDKIEQKFANVPFRVIFLGDYIDRGPDSRGVIDTLLDYRAERPDSVFLKGNHEQAIMDFLAAPQECESWLGWGGEETLASYGIPVELPLDLDQIQAALASALPDSHFDFLMNLELTHEQDDYFFVHAGVNPQRSLNDQAESDLLWIRDQFFAQGRDRFPEVTIVHGHTPVKKATDLNWRINVDTGAVWSSKLTGVVLQGKRRSFIST